jgi:hypothetical protein
MKPDYNSSKLPPFFLLDEPLLTFNAEDTNLDTNPLRGLDRYGTYNNLSFTKYSQHIRLATIGPANGRAPMRELVNTLRSVQNPTDRKEYLPTFRGFNNVFGVPLSAASASCHIQLPSDIFSNLSGESPHIKLISILQECMDRLSLVRDQFDVVLVHLPEAWSHGFRAPGFDAHDALKAIGAQHSIPTQVINDRAFSFTYKASLAWRLSIALHVKAGGIPWKLAPLPGVPEGTAYIGLAYALRGDPTDARYVTCCSQVFDADGGGMQFVAFEAKDPIADIDEARRNPFLSRSDMRAVLARSLSLYQSRNGGSIPRRLVIHKTTSFKPEELAGVQDALSAIPEVECVEIGTSASWRGIWLKESHAPGKKSEADGYPVPRGTLLFRTGNSTLLWAAGNAPKAALKGDYYQGKKSIPRPLSIIRHSGKGPLELTALEVLALTKMDWNNDALYDPVPVTIRYSQKLARTIANVPTLPGHSYPYRLFM